MANPKHLKILKRGVGQWNEWRKQHPEIRPDLSGADLSYVDQDRADLGITYMQGINLEEANLNGANLRGVYFWGANLKRAIFTRADFWKGDLSHASLSGAHLWDAKFGKTNLQGADLQGADLQGAEFHETNLCDTNFSGTKLLGTFFASVDLRQTRGLAEIEHRGVSFVQLHTVQLPSDGSALHFLRGTGFPDEWIDFWRTTTIQPIQYRSLFISYSHNDEALARRLHADLQAHGVRCWFAPEDLKIGTKFRQRIDEAIHLHDKLLLLLSEHSIASSWVENEVEAALEKEDQEQREVLFPVRLDDTVMQTSQSWAATLRRMRHIGDFTNWTNPQAYQQAFERLLRDLKAES